MLLRSFLMARFIRSYKVRFEDCDLAGIVFYPHYVLMLNRLFEDWFSEALDVPLGVLHRVRNHGVPTVSLQIEFKKTSRLEDVLEWSLEVRRLGTKSITLGVSASCQGEERIALIMVVVAVDLISDGVTSCAIPEDLMVKMKNYMVV